MKRRLQEGGINRLAEGVEEMPVVGDDVLFLVPEWLDLVEVRRVARQEQQLAADLFDQRAQPGAFVEGGVVQNHDLPWPQCAAQLLLKPRLDESAVAVALECQRSQHLPLTPTRRHRDAT